MRCTLCAGPAVKRDTDYSHCRDGEDDEDEDEDHDHDHDDGVDDDDDEYQASDLRRWEAIVGRQPLKEI